MGWTFPDMGKLLKNFAKAKIPLLRKYINWKDLVDMRILP